MRSYELAQTFTAQLEAVRSGGEATRLTHQFDDAIGRTQLHIHGLRLTENGESRFGLYYEHQSRDGSSEVSYDMRDLLPSGGDFTYDQKDTGFRTAWDHGYRPVPVIDLSDMTRGNLLALGHEVGHANQLGLRNLIVGYTTTGIMSAAAQKALDPYGPAAEALIGYVENTTYRQDLGRMDEIVAYYGLADTVKTLLQKHHIVTLMKHHETAGNAISAIEEADAWVRAFSFVDEGYLHPGMTRQQMITVATGYVATYEAGSSRPLHVDTLQCALNS